MKRRLPSSLTYLQRWLLYGVLIGVFAGLGAALFSFFLQQATAFFLGYLAGYIPPLPAGEGELVEPNWSTVKWWILPLIPALGAILSGFVVYSLAPEAEGHGTDAVIESFHRAGGYIRRRVPFIKTLASAITIGSGGSAGSEGPMSQIGAGFGSWLASVLKLSEHDRRIMVVSGAAAGVGSIFKVPLGGAFFGIEVLYRQDFEIEALIPSFVSSVVGYSVFSSIYGFAPIFQTHEYVFTNPLTLFFYAMLGLLLAPAAIGYVKTFYGLREKVFRRLNIPNYLKPAIGGLVLGISALLVPQTLGTSYGWVQLAIYGKIALTSLLLIGIFKIIATSLTISSGGSGGVFAPSLVIGGMLGGAIGIIFNTLFPGFVPALDAFVVVGMAAFLAGAAHVPIASMIMVAEMTGNYALLIPAMLACSITYLLVGKWTIYEKQVASRVDSPAHRGEFIIDVLEQMPVAKVASKRVVTLSPTSSVKELAKLVSKTEHLGYPVVEDGRLAGIVTYSDLLKVPVAEADSKTVGEIMTRKLHVTYPHENLDSALRKMQNYGVGRLPVVDPHNQTKLVGILTRSDLIKGHEDVRHSGIIKRKADLFDRVTVGGIMSRNVVTVTPDTTISEFYKIVGSYGYQGYPVLQDGSLVGMVTFKGLIDCMMGGRKRKTVSDIMEKNYEVAYVDETVSEAILKMYRSRVGRLAVVDRTKPDKLLGIVSKTDIVLIYVLERLE